ncbi:MAG: hexokinase [Spirochaetia bacterium]|jgi:hexokinase|nr:hexokinase [Spirochaetia bacterium]
MNKHINTGKEFLRTYNMNPENFDIDESTTLFLNEMEKGLSSTESALMMIPTYIETEADIPLGEPVIVLDAGGTNFRTATVRFDKPGVPIITKYHKFPMPGTGNEGNVSRQDFFDRIATFMEESVSESKKIGFCFSYPTEIYPTGEGKLLHFTKEVKAPEVVGSLIGKNLLSSLHRAGMDNKKDIVILNDTVATLLAGKAQEKKYSSYIGFILGTGTNCSYNEKNSNIGKLHNLDPNRGQVINTESGRFSLFKGGILDEEFAATTDKPLEGKMEKMVSGAYQGSLALHVLKRAANDGLFSDTLKTEILTFKALEPVIMDGFLNQPGNIHNPLGKLCNTDSDRIILFTIMDQLIERAARLAAAELSAMVLKTGKGDDPTFPVCIVADGTTYYKTRELKFRTEFYLKEYLENTKHRYVEFCHLNDAPLIGAAVAGLLH